MVNSISLTLFSSYAGIYKLTSPVLSLHELTAADPTYQFDGIELMNAIFYVGCCSPSRRIQSRRRVHIWASEFDVDVVDVVRYFDYTVRICMLILYNLLRGVSMVETSTANEYYFSHM